MANNEKWKKPAGIDDTYGLNIMNIAAEPERNTTKAEKGPKIVRESVSSELLEEGVSIKAYNNTEKDR